MLTDTLVFPMVNTLVWKWSQVEILELLDKGEDYIKMYPGNVIMK